MPALGIYQRVVIKGQTFTSEIWQTGFYVIDTTPPPDQATLQALCNTLEPLVNTWWTSIKANLPAGFTYTGISMYQYVDPSTIAQFQAQTLRAAVAGTSAVGQSPIDTACVVSLRSSLPGRSGRNRMYVPCTAAVNQATGMWDSTVPDGIGTATKALMTACAGAPNALPVVVSRTLHQYHPLSGLNTDSKPDVQRRRENRLVPNHTQVLAFP